MPQNKILPYAHAHTHTKTHTYIYIYKHAHTHARTQAHIHTHTHTHAHTHAHTNNHTRYIISRGIFLLAFAIPQAFVIPQALTIPQSYAILLAFSIMEGRNLLQILHCLIYEERGKKRGRKKERQEEWKIALNDRVRIMTLVKDSGFLCCRIPPQRRSDERCYRATFVLGDLFLQDEKAISQWSPVFDVQLNGSVW